MQQHARLCWWRRGLLVVVFGGLGDARPPSSDNNSHHSFVAPRLRSCPSHFAHGHLRPRLTGQHVGRLPYLARSPAVLAVFHKHLPFSCPVALLPHQFTFPCCSASLFLSLSVAASRSATRRSPISRPLQIPACSRWWPGIRLCQSGFLISPVFPQDGPFHGCHYSRSLVVSTAYFESFSYEPNCYYQPDFQSAGSLRLL